MGSRGAADLVRAELCCGADGRRRPRPGPRPCGPARAARADRGRPRRPARRLDGHVGAGARVAGRGPGARARVWLGERLAELPLEVDEDEAGNLWAVLPGARPETVVVGSHLDSVP